jgi:hypothetical protein
MPQGAASKQRAKTQRRQKAAKNGKEEVFLCVLGIFASLRAAFAVYGSRKAATAPKVAGFNKNVLTDD